MDSPNQIAAEGDNVTFDCRVTGTAPFTVIWMNSSMNVLVESVENESRLSNLTLSLTNVTNMSYQTYTCIGRSDSNETFVSASATLSKLLNY